MRRTFTLQMGSNPNLDPAWRVHLPGCPRCGSFLDVANFNREGVAKLYITAVCIGTILHPATDENCEWIEPCGVEADFYRWEFDHPELTPTLLNWRTMP